MEYTLVKGWTHEKGSRRGNLGLLMQDINWTQASRGTKPRAADEMGGVRGGGVRCLVD